MVIYKTINLINGKFYIGKDKNNNPKYLGSGKILKFAIKKYSKENFKKEILETCRIEELNEREKYWIEKLNPEYNIAGGGTGGNTLKYANKETIIKYKQKQKEIFHSKIKYSEGYRNRGIKISEAKKGIKFTTIHKKNLSVSHLGNKGLTKTTNKNIKKFSESKKYKFENKLINFIILLYRQISPAGIINLLSEFEIIDVSTIVIRRILKEIKFISLIILNFELAVIEIN